MDVPHVGGVAHRKSNGKYAQLKCKGAKSEPGFWNFFHLLNLPHEQSCELRVQERFSLSSMWAMFNYLCGRRNKNCHELFDSMPVIVFIILFTQKVFWSRVLRFCMEIRNENHFSLPIRQKFSFWAEFVSLLSVVTFLFCLNLYKI